MVVFDSCMSLDGNGASVRLLEEFTCLCVSVPYSATISKMQNDHTVRQYLRCRMTIQCDNI